jgi:hypothetical protein
VSPIAIASDLSESTIARERNRGVGSMRYADLLWIFAVRVEFRAGNDCLRIDEAPLLGLMFGLLDGIETVRRGGHSARARIDDPEGMFSLQLIRSGDRLAVTREASTVWIEADVMDFKRAACSWSAGATEQLEAALPELSTNQDYGRVKQELTNLAAREFR